MKLIGYILTTKINFVKGYEMATDLSQRQEIFAELIKHIHSKLSKTTASLLEKFVIQYYANVALEELQERSIIDLFGAAFCHWELINSRKPGECKIHIYNPHYEYHSWQSKHTIVEVAHDDMPFLVDSIRLAITRMGFDTHLMVHVGGLKLKRNKQDKVTHVLPIDAEIKDGIVPEAPIHIEIDKQTDPEILQALKEKIEAALADVRRSVEDWPAMIAKMKEVLREVGEMKVNLEPEEVAETKDFLLWLMDNHFTFLGYRKYVVVQDGQDKGLEMLPETGLGVLRQVDQNPVKNYRPFSTMSPEAFKQAVSSHLLIITKTNTKATVHRDCYTDYIGIKVFDKKGDLIAEHRFIGLYTSTAYTSNPKFIPFVRRKVALILKNFDFSPNGHAAKVLRNILDTFPRDDLFQATPKELTDMALGILNLQERKRIRMFARVDVYRRFVSCLVYVPRDRFNTDLAYAMQEILQKEFKALEVSFTTWFAESILARIHYVLRIDSQKPRVYDYKAIEQKLIEVGRTWQDELRSQLIEYNGEEKGILLAQMYQAAFPAGYRETFDARHALHDVHQLEKLSPQNLLLMNFYRPFEEINGHIRLKLFGLYDSIPLSDVIPIFENMGLQVLGERPYSIIRKDGQRFWISDFTMNCATYCNIDMEAIKERFQDAFLSVWLGDAENDSFNRLVILAGLTWREVLIIRVYAKYLRQTKFTYSLPYIESCFNKYPAIASMLVQLFILRFNPKQNAPQDVIDHLNQNIMTALEQITMLDEDKILRTFHRLIFATLRTNYFQTQSDGSYKPYVSIKLNPRELGAILPLPLPMFEIFVCSPQFEGIHLRNFYVARGGLRWSDRPEDFRTEVLGLVKAQNVKNSIIVPAGSKGGFVPKRLPQDGTRDEVMAEAISCYKNFIRGLLDLTDNFQMSQVIPALDVVRYDQDDTYLVVAADKGTASFSDIANEISKEYNFWLGDGFASGGSTGYDHKKMGITARGAWESVKRHFRMLGINTQEQDFTVVGIGDMSGDVFGNGMLLSRHIKLVGAFDHRHIFIDPNPDAEISYQERKRLFELPRSSWADYNPKLISKGGGVFERSLKSIQVSPEMQALFDIEQDHIEPNELIQTLLKANVDLLFNGGIGTYVKSSTQSHAEVGDRANDLVRVNGKDLRCQVVAEGGNLGLTQLGRIEYALNGGHIYTDFIDNSAGVDCSDHEVNIKILLHHVMAQGDMTLKQRDQLLQQMTDDVAYLVLQDNYRQTLALRLAHHSALEQIDTHTNYIRYLAENGLINRDIEFLPNEAAIIERKAAGKGLTMPELAILLSYCKTNIKQEILASEVPEDYYLSSAVVYAFPKAIRERYRDAMNEHPLRREIVATIISNGLVNEMGFTFLFELNTETGASVAEITRMYAVVRTLFKLPRIADEILELDYVIDPVLQLELLASLSRIARYSTRWLLKNQRLEANIEKYREYFETGIMELTNNLSSLLTGNALHDYHQKLKELKKAKVSDNIAQYIASEASLISGLDIIDAANKEQFNIANIAKVYFSLGELLDLNWLQQQIRIYKGENQWDGLARDALADNLAHQHRNLAIAVMKNGKAFPSLDEKLNAWQTRYSAHISRWHVMLANLKSTSSVTMTMLLVAVRVLEDMAKLSENAMNEMSTEAVEE